MLPLHVGWYLPLPTHSNKLALTTQKLMRNPTQKLITHTLPYPKTHPKTHNGLVGSGTKKLCQYRELL